MNTSQYYNTHIYIYSYYIRYSNIYLMVLLKYRNGEYINHNWIVWMYSIFFLYYYDSRCNPPPPNILINSQ